MKTSFIAALATLVLAGSASLHAQQPPQPPQPRQLAPTPPAERRPGFAGPLGVGFAVAMFDPSRLLERRDLLVLTADQVTRLSTLENELRAAREKVEADTKPHREELEKLFKQSVPDVAQVRTHAQALMQAQQAAQLTHLTTSVQAKAVLTAEQRGRVQGWAEGGRALGMRRMGGPGMGPGGMQGPREGARMRRAPLRRM